MKKNFLRVLSLIIVLQTLLSGVLPAAAAEKEDIVDLSNVKQYSHVTGEKGNALSSLPDYPGGKLVSSVNGLYGLVTYAVQKTTPEAYVSFLQDLEKDGWEQYSNNIIEKKNLFATYVKDDSSVYAYYIDTKKTAYISLSPNRDLPGTEKDNKWEKKTTPQLTQVKTLSREVVEGMCYILRLSDGRFIIVDGGWNEADQYEAKKLYKRLEEQNVLDKITVAAWFITHPHGDHLGAVNDFIKLYANDVTIEQMVFHFPTDEIYAKSSEAYLVTDMSSARVQTFFLNLKKYLPEQKIVTAHTGQEFFLADAHLEMLHTLEDYYPKTIDQNGSFQINSISTLFTVTIAGQKILFTGDLDPIGSNDAADMWGDYLKSDILQMNHHGLIGATVKFYECVSPVVAMQPAAASFHFSSWNEEGSKWLFEGNCPDLKEVIVSGFLERTIPLPYTPENDELIPNQYAIVLEEPERSGAKVPAPYFDLGFSGKDVEDTADNTTVTMQGGAVGENTVIYNDKKYEVTSYRAEKAGEYVDIELEGIRSAEELGDFLLSGCTFEMFVALDKTPTKTCGFLSSNYSGGVSLYLRGPGGCSFQIGNLKGDGKYPGSGYSYVTTDVTSVRIFGGKNVTHVLGTYDPDDNTLNLYFNGIPVFKADYGTRSFNIGNSIYNHLGIGQNVSYPSETLAGETPFTVLRSRVYDVCLTPEEVAAEYWDCIDSLTGGIPETVNETDAQTDTGAVTDKGTASDTSGEEQNKTEKKTSSVVPAILGFAGGILLCAAVVLVILKKKGGKR